jgi:hypothetical protein
MSKDKWGYAGTWGYAPTAWPAAATPNAYAERTGRGWLRVLSRRRTRMTHIQG